MGYLIWSLTAVLDRMDTLGACPVLFPEHALIDHFFREAEKNINLSKQYFY